MSATVDTNNNNDDDADYQLRKLQVLIVDNKIGVDIGGVSWQEIKIKIYVPISSWR